MAHRVTKDELLGLAASLNEMTRRKHGFEIQWAYGQPRLVAYNGSEEISPRLSAGDLAQWIRAYARGYSDAQRSRK